MLAYNIGCTRLTAHLLVSREVNIIILQLIIVLTFIMLAWPTNALADAGLPMLALAWPGMFLALIPIILIEAWYLHTRLKIPFGRSTKVTTISNLISTTAGIPLAWGAMLLIEMAGGILVSQFPTIGSYYEKAFGAAIMTMVGAAWIAPDEKSIHWTLPLAFIVLMVPFFFASWWIENKSVKRQMSDVDPDEIKIVTRNQNLLSYGLLELMLLIWLIVELIRKHN